MQDPLDDFLAATGLIERFEGTAQSIPRTAALVDDVFDVAETRCRKSEIVMDCRAKQSGFLRHQSTKSEKKDRNAAGQSFVRGQRTRLCEDQV